MRRPIRDFRAVWRPVGAVVTLLGVAILVSTLGGWAANFLMAPSPNHRVRGGEVELLMSAVPALAVGLIMYWAGKRRLEPTDRRAAVLAVGLIWVSAGVFGAVPFMVGAHMPFHDAFFESISGFTTTGATVVTDIEGTLTRPVLLWRSAMQWLGGMGIVVLFVAVFPNIGAGGKHMFGEEVPGTSAEGLRPRIAETSRLLWWLYLAFTAVLVLILRLLGMPLFDSICHAFTTLSTGGFSTRDASIAAFQDPWVEYVLAGFMILASVNYGLYYAFLIGTRSVKVFVRSLEFKVFVSMVLIATLWLTTATLELSQGDLALAFRRAVFQVATFVSSTGFVTDDYMAYPSHAIVVIVLVMFVGGCAGSTAGGIKVERVVVMTKASWAQLRSSFRPSLVQALRMGTQVVPRSALVDVAVFHAIFIGSLAFGVLAIVVLEAIPVDKAFGAVLSCVSNMGPAPFHGGTDNFAQYGPLAKFVFSFVMLLGRLEFFALLSLLVPDFWRR
ncbi:MAG: TrkH family potassium uptake protein [Deltaproteobacteria bacterium]|nr:TrkH family potassium uptake protein [Deltaproteobacteria bacterium]